MVLIAAIILIFIVFLGMLPLEFETEAQQSAIRYQYHFLMDVGSPTEHFSSEFISGAQQAAEEYGVLLEVAGLNSALSSGDQGLIEKGIFERVDGIIHTGRSMDSEEQEWIKNSSCQVLCVNNQCDTQIMSYVGPDNRAQGRAVIQNLQTRGQEPYRVVILINEVEKELGNLRYQGMMEALKSRPEIQVLETLYVPSNVLDAMAQTQDSILAYPNIDCFIGTDETILTGIARGVVDLNRVPEIDIAGVGVGADVEHYLQNGIIDFTMDPLTYEMGYEAVVQLYRQCNEELPQQRMYTDYQIKISPESEL